MSIQTGVTGNKILKASLHEDYHPAIGSFIYAGRGILYFFRNEYNARIHLIAAVLVVILCFIYHVTRAEIMLLAFAIAIVWISEMMNTAIEKAMDFISIEKHNAIRIVKDVAAGAVLIASCVSVLIGAIIFIPKAFNL